VSQDKWDWKLHLAIQKINKTWGPCVPLELFASRLTHQLPVFYSWRPGPQAAATDAFLQARSVMQPPMGINVVRDTSRCTDSGPSLEGSIMVFNLVLSLLLDYLRLILQGPY